MGHHVFSVLHQWLTDFLTDPICFLQHLRWLLKPAIILFLLPLMIIVLFVVTAFLIQLYLIRRYVSRRGRADEHSIICLIPLRRLVAAIWYIHGRIFHGYEVVGLEKIASEGPAYVVYYHGTVPLDIYYLMATCILIKDKCPVPVVDKFLFNVPGLHGVLELSRATPGTVEGCVESLRQNEVILLSPGGVREALFANEYYQVVWGRRLGFAKVARLANVPIYPMFTENVREPIRVVQFGKKWIQKIYEKTRLPIALLYGYFPVKMRTHIGDPINLKPDETDEELAERVRLSIEAMIHENQTIPGNIFVGILQRFPYFDRWLHSK